MSQHTFVLVAGANHGGWWYAPLVEALEEHGHRALAVTLLGLDPDRPPAPEANLDDHVAQLRATIEGMRDPVVLVGHSYGGSVITGAADLVPDRVEHLVYLDAFVPADGDSAYSMAADWAKDWYLSGAAETGRLVAPLPSFDEKAMPHPLATLLQRSRITGAVARVPRRSYVLAADPEWKAVSGFAPFADAHRAEPGWDVVDATSAHNLLRDGPELLTRILLDLTADIPSE